MKKLVIILSIALSITLLIILFMSWKNHHSKVQFKDDIETLKGKYTDELGHQVTFTQAVQTRLSEMEAASKKDSSVLNQYQNRLAWAYKEIEALNINLKKVTEFIIASTHVSGDFTTPLKDTIIKQKPYKIAYYSNGYLDEMITIPENMDSVNVYYSHSDTLLITDFMQRKPNKKGKQVFFLWRWLRPWEIEVEAKTSDPNSIIVNIDKVIIKK